MRKSFHPAHKALYYGIGILSAFLLFIFLYFSYVVYLTTFTEVTYFYIITFSVFLIVMVMFVILLHHGRKGAVVRKPHPGIKL